MSDEDIPTLEQAYDKWYKSNHKMSADKQWLAYRAHILDYPDKVIYQDQSWILYQMSCGKRNDPDELFLMREVSRQEALFDEEFNKRRYSWYAPNYVVSQTTGSYYRIERPSTYWFTVDAENPHDFAFTCWIKKFDQTTPTQRKVTMSRTSGWCDNPLSYEVNEHSMSVDVSKAGRSIRLELSECSELASFLATAKDKIKEAKIASLKEQQDALQKALRDVEGL
jgi:hypothetical protein